MNKFLAKIVAWITSGYPGGCAGPGPRSAFRTDEAAPDRRRGEGRRKGIDGPRRVRPRRHRCPDHPDHRRTAAPRTSSACETAWPPRAGRSMTRETPRRRNSRPARRLRPARPVGPVGAARGGGGAGRAASAMLPVPADDERETRLLTTSLRAGEDIDDDVAVVVSTSGTTGTPKGAMLTAAALTASAEATHRRLGGPGRWLLALPAHHIAGLQVLVRSVIAGTRAGRGLGSLRRGRTARGRFGDGFRPALRLAGGRTAGQGAGRPGRRRGARPSWTRC